MDPYTGEQASTSAVSIDATFNKLAKQFKKDPEAALTSFYGLNDNQKDAVLYRIAEVFEQTPEVAMEGLTRVLNIKNQNQFNRLLGHLMRVEEQGHFNTFSRIGTSFDSYLFRQARHLNGAKAGKEENAGMGEDYTQDSYLFRLFRENNADEEDKYNTYLRLADEDGADSDNSLMRLFRDNANEEGENFDNFIRNMDFGEDETNTSTDSYLFRLFRDGDSAEDTDDDTMDSYFFRDDDNNDTDMNDTTFDSWLF